MITEPLHLSIEPDGASGQANHIHALLEEANAYAKYPREERNFCAVLRSADGTIRGGVTARSFWGWLYIISIAIETEWRGHGYGRAWLMTMSFQARGFYEHSGYNVFAELPAFPDHQSRLFMRKALAVRT
jgi:GNAT superfamily N-acetyltransferase